MTRPDLGTCAEEAVASRAPPALPSTEEVEEEGGAADGVAGRAMRGGPSIPALAGMRGGADRAARTTLGRSTRMGGERALAAARAQVGVLWALLSMTTASILKRRLSTTKRGGDRGSGISADRGGE
jgi:hypothetical protein